MRSPLIFAVLILAPLPRDGTASDALDGGGTRASHHSLPIKSVEFLWEGNDSDDDNSTTSPVPTVSPTKSNETTVSPAPSPAPSSPNTTISPAPTVAPTTSNETTSPVPTATPETPAPTVAPTSHSDSNDDDDYNKHHHNHHHHRFHWWKIIVHTLGWLLLAGLSLLGFGACMSNRYRLYYYARGVWYSFLRAEATQWVLTKLRLDGWVYGGRSRGGGGRGGGDSSLNDIIFEGGGEGLLMQDT